MNTQTHVLMGALIFGKPLPRLALAGAAGGFLPDMPMYVIIGSLRFEGYSFDRIFGEFYWQDWWQIANAIGHNFLLWGLLSLVLGLYLVKSHNTGSCYKAGKLPALAFAVCASALVHSIVDFLLHHNDAHMHFWPLSQWRFQSPVSYWDPAYYGRAFSLFEAALGLTMAVLLIRRYTNIGIRLILALAIIAYVAVPAFYFWSLSNHNHTPQNSLLRGESSVEPIRSTSSGVQLFFAGQVERPSIE
jgi:membrane-bound metal-dependent hydrolase YbcI (DUF457 family)